MVEGVSSGAILVRSGSSSSPSPGCSGGAAGDSLQSQQRRPQLGQYQSSSDLTGLPGLGVGGLLVGDLSVGDLSVGDLEIGERSAESARLLLSVSREEGDRWHFFRDTGGGVGQLHAQWWESTG